MTLIFDLTHRFRFFWLYRWCRFCWVQSYICIRLWHFENVYQMPLQAYAEWKIGFRLQQNTSFKHPGVNACCESDKNTKWYCYFYMDEYTYCFTGCKNRDDFKIRSYHRLKNKTIDLQFHRTMFKIWTANDSFDWKVKVHRYHNICVHNLYSINLNDFKMPEKSHQKRPCQF